MVAFTGSAPNGSRVAEVGSKTLKRLLLELGGKSAFVVLESADVAEQAALAAKTICANAGQGCVARSRLLLPRARYEEGIEAAKAAMDAVTVGDPQNPHNFMGPLNSKHHRERVLGYIERAKGDGNRLVRGGGVPEGLETGCFIEPTLFADVKPDDTIAQEEIFGPVLAVIPYDSEEEALEIANNRSEEHTSELKSPQRRFSSLSAHPHVHAQKQAHPRTRSRLYLTSQRRR